MSQINVNRPLTPVKPAASVQQAKPQAEPQPKAVEEAQKQAPAKPAVAAEPAPLPPAEEAKKDADKALASYAAKKNQPFGLSMDVSSKLTLMSDFGKKTDMFKTSLAADFTFMDAYTKLDGGHKLGVSSNISPGISMKNYEYSGKNKSEFTVDLGLDVKPYMKAKMGKNYLKFGPTVNATGRYNATKDKPGFDMTVGAQATYQVGDWGLGAFYNRGVTSEVQGQNMGGLKVSYNIFK